MTPEALGQPTPAEEKSPVAEDPGRGDRIGRRRAALALGAVVGLATLAYAAAGQLVAMPLLNPDELRYTLAAGALVDGESLNLRGREYGYGALYPVLLAPILVVSGTVEAAYPFFKLANAALFALAAVPIFFLARRLLSRWWCVAVAAMSVAIPSSIYTPLVLTESVSYLTCSIAMLAVVLALERPSLARQLVLIGAVGLAYTARVQFAALLPAFLAGYVLLWAIDAERPRMRSAAARLWPTISVLALGMAALVVRPLLGWSGPTQSLEGYGDLWRGYDLLSVARLAMYHLAGLEMYLFVVPLAVAPVVVHELWGAARRGSTREGAFVAAFLAVNAVFLLIASAFASTPFGWGELHDRYLFYVAPLWLVVFATWLSRGLPRPFAWLATGIVLALVLPAFTPHGLIAGNNVIEFVPSGLWSATWAFFDGYPLVDGRRALAATVLVLAVAAAAVPRRLWMLLPVLVVAGLVLNAAFAWQRVADEPEAFLIAGEEARTWVDDAVRNEASVTKMYLDTPQCPWTEATRHALFLTEFFNSSIDRVATIGDSPSDGLPIDRVDVGPAGRLTLEDGEPLVADHVVTQHGIDLHGRRVAVGTGLDLVLWETGGVVRLADPRLGASDLVTADCR